MKKGLVLILAAMLFIPLPAGAIELTDYLLTDLLYQDALVEARFTFQDGNQDQASYSGLIDAEYFREYSTLPMKWETYATAIIDFARGADDDANTTENYQIDAWTQAQKYLNDYDKWFVFGRLDVGLRDLEDIEDDDPFVQVTAGGGYGRIFNATPLMEAYRVVEDLQEYGVISGTISDETYLKLADVIAKEDEYEAQYSLREYEKYWYEAMQQVLADAGVLTGPSLGAMGVIRIQDILTDESVLRRAHGWEVSAGIGYLISDYSGNEGDPLLNAAFRYAKPFGFDWQLIEELSYSTILEDWEFGDTDHKISNLLSLSYEISDTIDWINEWHLDIILASEDNEDDTYQNLLATELRYYVTNTLDAIARLEFFHLDDGDDVDEDIETRFSMGLVYHIF